MLSWIPFRTNSITEATKMWVKIINPFEYDTLNLHENAYLLATLLLIGVILTYCLKLIIKKKKNCFTLFNFFKRHSSNIIDILSNFYFFKTNKSIYLFSILNNFYFI